jgi:hypothetical protein
VPWSLALDDLGTEPSAYDAIGLPKFLRLVEHRMPSILEQSLRILAIPLKKFDMPLISFNKALRSSIGLALSV